MSNQNYCFSSYILKYLKYKATALSLFFFLIKLCALLHLRRKSSILTRHSHFQVSSDSAYKIRRRTLPSSTSSSLMCVNVQEQHFIQHDLTEFWRKLCDKL